MRKLSFAFVIALSITGVVAIGSAGAASKPAAAKLSIRGWPGGVFGYLDSSAQKCANGRQVVVFEQRGEARDPGTDPQVGADRATPDEGSYQWSVATAGSGPFYAAVAAKPGCAAALSGAGQALVGGAAAGADNYPPCGPYTAEGIGDVCRLEQIHDDYSLPVSGWSCDWSDGGSACIGSATGPYPWGVTRTNDRSNVQIDWGWNGKSRSITVTTKFANDLANPVAQLIGTLPGPASDRFTITDAWAQTETGRAHFYTPDLPGQGAGEVGGPLRINFENGKFRGADDWIEGYLYVKR